MAEGKEKVTITSDHFDRESGKLVTAGTTLEVTPERRAALEKARVIGGRQAETAARKPSRTADKLVPEGKETKTRKPAEKR